MNTTVRDDGWRITDALWERMALLLPVRKPHPFGGHWPRIPDRAAMDGLLLVLRTGMQWSALDQTGICTGSAAYRRFREWLDAGVFQAFRDTGLLHCETLSNIDWSWLGTGMAATDHSCVQETTQGKPRPRLRWRRAPPLVRQ